MPNVSNAASSNPSILTEFAASVSTPVLDGRALDIEELATRIARQPSKAAFQLLAGSSDPSQPTHLFQAVLRDDKIAVSGLLKLIEQCWRDRKLDQMQCSELLHGGGAQEAGQHDRDGAMWAALSSTKQMHRTLMLHYAGPSAPT
ncbi:hypothetical protein CDL60_00540 [Roseateles noduli]|nr:hypothetical protein CDL60_00540 [Roseateles noduli]